MQQITKATKTKLSAENFIATQTKIMDSTFGGFKCVDSEIVKQDDGSNCLAVTATPTTGEHGEWIFYHLYQDGQVICSKVIRDYTIAEVVSIRRMRTLLMSAGMEVAN